MLRSHAGAGSVLRPALALAALAGALAIARAAEMNDLRDLRVGMPVAELPAKGYVGLACAADPTIRLAGWSEYTKCPPDQAGRRAVGFRYDQATNPLARVNDVYTGTRVGGHPVLLALLIGRDGRVDAMRIDTDPHAGRYMHKKAFLLGEQVKERYGPHGWTCMEGEPTAAQQPIGGTFVKEHCEKQTPARHLVLDRALYHDPAGDPAAFVNATHLLIEATEPAGR
jgi:hypothetical protein